MTSARTGCAHGEVYAAQVEDGAHVHRYGGVHRLEDVSAAEERRVVFGFHDAGGFDDGCRRGVVAKDAAYFVAEHIIFVDSSHCEGFLGGHECVFAFFGQAGAHAAVEQSFELRAFNNTGEPRLITILQSRAVEADAASPRSQAFRYFLSVLSEASPEADACHYDSFHE